MIKKLIIVSIFACTAYSMQQTQIAKKCDELLKEFGKEKNIFYDLMLLGDTEVEKIRKSISIFDKKEFVATEESYRNLSALINSMKTTCKRSSGRSPRR